MHSSDAELARQVWIERVRLFFGHASGNMAGIAAGAALIGAVLHSGGAPWAWILGWAGSLVVSLIAVLGLERRVRIDGIHAANADRWLRWRIALGAWVAGHYGVAGFLLPETGVHAEDTYLFIIMSTLVTVGALGYAAMPAYSITLNVVGLLPISLHFAQIAVVHGDRYYFQLAAVSVVWQAVVLGKARRVSATAIDAIVLTARLQAEVEEHKRTKEAIRHLALHDDLTGLANRRAFEQTLERARSLARRGNRRFGLLALDLDHFKPINDRYGHAMGDRVLQTVGERLRAALRSSDFSARLGGDEFAVLIEQVDSADQLRHVAEKLSTHLAVPYPTDGHDIPGGASVGWALWPDDGDSADALMRAADARMYAQKRRRAEG